jgi:energy-coupling factor transport system ATP-binding protein
VRRRGVERERSTQQARSGHVIRFSDVTLAYRRDARPALSGLDFTIGAGESVAIVGPSGSGKTSILRLMNALLVPTSGTVNVFGMDTCAEENTWDVRRRVGLIFQNPDNQLVSTTVERELAFGMENLGLPQPEIAERVESALRDFRLLDLRYRAPHRLSGGEKQRVAIAAVLAMRPDCLLLDEPTSLLDAAGRREVWKIIESLRSDASRTVVHVTQFPNEICLSERVIVIFGGQTVFDGPPSRLFDGRLDLTKWGLRRPAVMDLADELRCAGYDIPTGASTVDDLADALVSSRPGEAQVAGGVT